MSALTHSPGFFDFLGDIARTIAPIATIAAPFFPPAAAIAGVANVVAAATRPSPPAALVMGPSQSIGSSFPSVPTALGIAGPPPEIIPFDEPYAEEFEEEEEF